MSLHIGELEMSSFETCHRAVRKWDGCGESWLVTWIPGRRLTRIEAITALTLAELVAEAAQPIPADTWVLITDLAGELDIAPDEAQALILAPRPGDDAEGQPK